MVLEFRGWGLGIRPGRALLCKCHDSRDMLAGSYMNGKLKTNSMAAFRYRVLQGFYDSARILIVSVRKIQGQP